MTPTSERLAEQAESWTYHLNDALGSLRQITSAEAEVLFAQSYEPYGKVYESSGTAASHYGFSGELSDPSELVYLRARYYQPGSGRFISRDTWGGNVYNPQSLNRWSYAAANPVMFVDPSGRYFDEREWMLDEDKKAGGNDSYPESVTPQLTGEDIYEVKIFPPYYDSDNLRSQQLSDQLELALIYYGEMQNGEYVYSDKLVPYGTPNSQYEIAGYGNLCLIAAGSSRIRQINGYDFSANKLFEMFLKQNPDYNNEMLDAKSLYDLVMNDPNLSENIFITYGRSGSFFGDSNGYNQQEYIVPNVQSALSNDYEIMIGVIAGKYDGGQIKNLTRGEAKGIKDVVPHWVSIVWMNDDYTLVSNTMDNNIQEVNTSVLINTWANWGVNNTIILSDKRINDNFEIYE